MDSNYKKERRKKPYMNPKYIRQKRNNNNNNNFQECTKIGWLFSFKFKEKKNKIISNLIKEVLNSHLNYKARKNLI